MPDTMRLLPFSELLNRIFSEYRSTGSVFGLPAGSWYRKSDERTFEFFGERAETPIGPAAGPHTQLAQNIVAAYLTGSRFIELKTVQVLDALEIEKPCIATPDEGYNTEWSTELSLDEAWQEYAKAWIALHLIEEVWGLRVSAAPRSFIFNMSVGYDLAGITSERVQQFIDRMLDSSHEPRFHRWLQEASETAPRLLAGTELEAGARAVPDLAAAVGSRISGSVTLSTLHGCPPREIESICRHLMEDKGLDVWVKLNPTLLGFDSVRSILDRLGYDYVSLDREGFEHDLQYSSAIEVITALREAAAASGRRFGIKLSNTLPTVNTAGRLPGEQMYMSGRPLYPLAITLAAQLAQEFDGALPISFSAGISPQNIAAVFATGIRPITSCTLFLKPGGYTRQLQLAREIEQAAEPPAAGIDLEKLSRLATQAISDRNADKQFRGTDEVRVPGELPAFDCYRAPCVSACAIGQHVPEYIRLVGEQRYGEALELIYERNALPAITGHICDHQCQLVCSRLDYEGCLNIRELKKIAAEQGYSEYRTRAPGRAVTRDTNCAVVGAGPAGLSAACFLAREGFAVTVFEREAHAGGVVRNVIPPFRLPADAIEQDISFIAGHGVEFRFGADPQLTAQTLRAQGFGPIVVTIGAEVDNEIPLAGDRSRVIRSLEFLWDYRGNAREVRLSGRVAVVGGGNTAMDAARAALTLPEVEEVTVLYRRSEAQMPADREEYHNAIKDGVRFGFLRNPERLETDGTLTVRVMELGEPDEGGRARPVATDRTEELSVDTLITAVGERVDSEMLARFGIPLDSSEAPRVDPHTYETALADVYLAGDALSGPSTVVRCIAAGRRVADAIAERYGGVTVRQPPVPQVEHSRRLAELRARKATVLEQPDPETYSDIAAFAAREYDRCLECSYVCNRCEEVCPNRANITVPVIDEPLFQDPFQIVHLDAYCNECDNCAQFCPWDELVPYRHKPTVFSTAEDFERSTNDGWLVTGAEVRIRFKGAQRELAPESKAPGQNEVREAERRAVADAESRAEQRFHRLFEILYSSRPDLFTPLTHETE